MPIIGYGSDYLFTDSDLANQLEIVDDMAMLDVLTDENGKMYVMLYLDTTDGALPITIYLADNEESPIFLTIGEKTYHIGLSDDDLGDLERFVFDEDDAIYILSVAETASLSLTLSNPTLYEGYDYALLYFESSEEFEEFISTATFEDLEDAGYLFRADPDTLTIEFNIMTISETPIMFMVIPVGVTTVTELLDSDEQPFVFYIQRNNVIFDIYIGEEQYYATTYIDFTSFEMNVLQDANTEETQEDEMGRYEQLIYFIGEDELDNIEDGTYTFFMDSNFYGIFFEDSEANNEIVFGSEGSVTLEVKEDGVKYVEFYYNLDYSGTCRVVLMFTDGIYF